MKELKIIKRRGHYGALDSYNKSLKNKYIMLRREDRIGNLWFKCYGLISNAWEWRKEGSKHNISFFKNDKVFLLTEEEYLGFKL